MRQQVPLKLQYHPTILNSVTSEKTAIFKFRAVSTSIVHPSFVFSMLITNTYPQGWKNEFQQLLMGREKVSCYHSIYTFQHSVWAGIIGEDLATKTNRKWLMLLENDLLRFQICSRTLVVHA
jgi:hypothetical protein